MNPNSRSLVLRTRWDRARSGLGAVTIALLAPGVAAGVRPVVIVLGSTLAAVVLCAPSLASRMQPQSERRALWIAVVQSTVLLACAHIMLHSVSLLAPTALDRCLLVGPAAFVAVLWFVRDEESGPVGTSPKPTSPRQQQLASRALLRGAMLAMFATTCMAALVITQFTTEAWRDTSNVTLWLTSILACSLLPLLAFGIGPRLRAGGRSKLDVALQLLGAACMLGLYALWKSSLTS